MLSTRYEWTLSNVLLDKAVNELNEPRDNSERLAAIDKLREAFLKKYSEQYTLIRSDDEFILRFLRAKKFNQEKALKTLVNYHSCRKDLPEIFDRVEKPAMLKDTLAVGLVYILPHKDKDGVTVMLSRNGLLNADVDLHNVLAICMLTMESLLEDEEFQINGLSIIKDMKDFNLKLMAKFSMSIMRKMTFMTQDAMPIRYKLTHIVNEGKIYDILYQMFKPLMKEKMKKRVRVHGADYSSLHQYIDPQFLPDYLDGTGGDPCHACIKWGEELCEWKEKGSISTCL